jgi:carbon-monoxide dehydrogenase small subunit
MPERVNVTVNGVAYERDVPARMTLADFLREELDLTATHLGCEHGVCGACTVHIDGHTARACITLAVQADGAAVTTAEGLAPDGQLTPVQQGFWEKHGMQCGFCTPGFLMIVTELLDENPDPSDEEIRDALGANLCRCTGYTKIVEAVHEAVRLTEAAR